MLDRPSFDAFKNELKALLFPHIDFNEISNAIDAINAVQFQSDNPKNAYFDLFQALKNSSHVPQPQQAGLINTFASFMVASPEANANAALTLAKKKAEAYHTTAVIKQDCAAAGIAINLDNVIQITDFKTKEHTSVTTNRRF